MVYRAPRHFSFVLLHYKNIKKIVNNSNELLIKIVCVFIVKSDLNTPHSLYYTTLKKTFYMVLSTLLSTKSTNFFTKIIIYKSNVCT